MSISDIAAWWGAIIASFVLIWDIFKWRKSGPKIIATARRGWKTFNIPQTEGHKLIHVTATNTGDRATTLTVMGLHWYPEGSTLADKTKRQTYVVMGIQGFDKIPQKIEPGDVWTNVIIEHEKIAPLLTKGMLVVALGFSHVEDDVLVGIK
ncbi:hypothetical protein KKA08_09975 [bacterium]|nr:hypothetical protein [bacterium]